MTVLGGLIRRGVENPDLPLTSTVLAEWLSGGPSAAGVSVTEKRVYGLTAYYRAIALTSSTMAALPLKVFTIGSRKRVRQKTVLDNPNPSQTPFEFWQSLFANSIGWGNGFARKVYNGGGIVSQAWIIHPSRARIEITDPSDTYVDGKVFLITDRHGREERLSSRHVFHLPYLSPHGFEGLAPLHLAKEVLGIGIAAEQTAAGFYGNGSRLSGALETDADIPDQETANRILARFERKHKGPRSAGKVVLLDNGLTYKNIGIPPADAELLVTRKFSTAEIARLVGTPPHLLSDVEKSTSWGTGIEQQFITWVQVTLNGWLTLAAQRATREFLPGGWTAGRWYAEHAVEGLLRGDSKARAAFYHQAVIDGWMNRNEVRARENLEPREGLDEFLVPSNLTLISVDGQLVPLSSNGINQGEADGTNTNSE